MAVKPVLGDNRNGGYPCPASIAIATGDLMWWDSANLVMKPAALRADKGSLIANQVDFSAVFLGVSREQRLATETSTGNDSRRVVDHDGVYDADCPSLTWEVGDFVAVDRSSTPANFSQQVNKVSTSALSIGICVRREPVAVTKVRCRLTSSLMFAEWARNPVGIGAGQGVGATALADAAATLTLAQGPILTMIPTAARNLTLPSEAIAALIGAEFYFTNNSAGAFSVTFLGSAGGSIKGNGIVPQNKTCHLWSDGTNWNGLTSA